MGKIHGSMSHTGKVKEHTPKVPKADNPRPKTGRAKKRILYNKRFHSCLKGPTGRELSLNCRARQLLVLKLKGKEEE